MSDSRKLLILGLAVFAAIAAVAIAFIGINSKIKHQTEEKSSLLLELTEEFEKNREIGIVNSKFLYASIPVQKRFSEIVDELQEKGDYDAAEKLLNAMTAKQQSIDEESLWKKQAEQWKSLKENPELETTAIIINGKNITKSQIEHSKLDALNIVNNEVVPIDLPKEEKKQIIENVRNEVVLFEAERKSIKPKRKQIEEYINEQKEMLLNSKIKTIVEILIKTQEITEEEYWKNTELHAYSSFQRSMLYDLIMTPLEEEINIEAGKRGAIVDDVRKEYWNKYVDILVIKAKIEIVDPELKEMFGIEDNIEQKTNIQENNIDLVESLDNSEQMSNPQEDTINFGEAYTVDADDDTKYFFIGNLMLGAYENSKFVSAGDREFCYGEFLSQPSFNLYEQSGSVCTSTNARIDKVPSLNNAADTILNTFASYKEDYLGEDCEYINVFDLPVQLPKEAYSIKYDDYNGYINFGEGILATNAEHDLLPRPVQKVAATEHDIEMTKKLLLEKGIPNSTVNIEDVYICDLEGDGIMERIFVSNEPWHDGKQVLDNSGNYTMLVIARGDKTDCIYIETAPFTTEQLNKLTSDEYEAIDLFLENFIDDSTIEGIFDLNGDGVFELCIRRSGWEWGCYLGFAMDKNQEYKQVMKREFGT